MSERSMRSALEFKVLPDPKDKEKKKNQMEGFEGKEVPVSKKQMK